MDSTFPDLKPIKDLKLNQICLSFDLETPNKFGAGIFSIGITPFSFETGEVFTDCSFYIRMDFEEVMNHSSNMGDTMKWWLQQDDAARFEVISMSLPEDHSGRIVSKDLPNFPYEEALMHTLSYIMMVKDNLITNGTLSVMGNGAIFDIGKFEDTLRQFGIIGGQNAAYPDKKFQSLCYKFWDILDLRSFRKMAMMATKKDPKKFVTRAGTHHNAVDDAVFQAEVAVMSLTLIEDCAAKTGIFAELEVRGDD